MAESDNGAINIENGQKLSKASQNPDAEEKNKTDKVLRPILLEEYKYEESPESLQNLMTFFESLDTSVTRIDILVGLVFLIMVESGFVPNNYVTSETTFEFNYNRTLMLSRKPINFLSHSSSCCIKMNLPNLEQFEVKLVIVPASDDLIINCFLKGIDHGSFKVLLDPLAYFTSSTTNLGEVKFQQLDQLSRLVKNEIAFPAKYFILKQNGIALPCLEDLPPEIVIMILKKLPLIDLLKFGKTCRKYKDLTRDLLKKFGKKMQ